MSQDASPRFYAVRPTFVLDLPDGRRKSILARKAIAGFLKLSHTRFLSLHGLGSDRCVLNSLESIARCSVVFSIPVGHEPRDGTDRNGRGESLEAFMTESLAELAGSLDGIAEEVAGLVEDGLHEEAFCLLNETMDDLPEELVGRLIPAMERVASHHPRARACLARVLLEEEHLDYPRAVSLLEGIMESEDADAVALAAVWLGDIYAAQPGGARKALRTFEDGAAVDHEEGYCALKAGMLAESGGDGLSPSPERAARNYRWGVEAGDEECMVRLGLLLARREAEALPGESWRRLLKVGAHESERGRAYLALIAGIEREVGGDPESLAERLRSAQPPEIEPRGAVEATLASLGA